MKKSLFNIQKDYKDLMYEVEIAEGILTDDQISAQKLMKEIYKANQQLIQKL